MGRKYTVYTASTTLTTAATKTLILLNPAGAGITLVEFGISLDNTTTNAEPVLIELCRATTIGTPAGTTGTLNPTDEAFEAATATALTILTTEPTTYARLAGWYVQPNSGIVIRQDPLGRELAVTKAAGQRIGLRYTTASGVTPKAVAYTIHEE